MAEGLVSADKIYFVTNQQNHTIIRIQISIGIQLGISVVLFRSSYKHNSRKYNHDDMYHKSYLSHNTKSTELLFLSQI